MTEPRFHARPQPLDLERLLALTGARLAGPIATPVAITGVGSVALAGPSEIACVSTNADAAALFSCEAGACLLTAEAAARAPVGVVALVSAEPLRALARVAAALFPDAAQPRPMFGAGVSPGSFAHPDARLEPEVSVDQGAAIGPRAEIGRGSVVGANAVIGPDVRIGRGGSVGPGAVVTNALIGDRVVIEPGVSIGHSDPDAAGGPPDLGRVVIQDDVRIGANAAVARGRRGDTIVGEGTRIDALVRIGPEASIGRLCVLEAGAQAPEGLRLDDYAVLEAGGPPFSREVAPQRDQNGAHGKDDA